MTTLMLRLRDELTRRAYSPATVHSYLHAVESFRLFCRKRLDHCGPDDLRRYHLFLVEDRRLAKATVILHLSALRFLYGRVLQRHDVKENLPYPKRSRRLPVVLSRDEVARLIQAAPNLFHRALLMTLYGAGLRRSEVCRLQVSHIDSQRMMLHVDNGKGGVDRDVPLSPELLSTLRAYWRWMRPKTYLFPGIVHGWRADKPITPKVVWEAVHRAARKAGLDKAVTPHTLRHSYATHLLEAGTDLRTIQLLLGHADLSYTAVYLHLSPTHLQATPNLLQQMTLPDAEGLPRSRKRQRDQ